MAFEQLQEDVRIIFEDEKLYRGKHEFNIHYPSSDAPCNFILLPDNYKYTRNFDNLDLLFKLYYSIEKNSAEKDFFISLISNKVGMCHLNEFAFEFLFKSKHIDAALSPLYESMKNTTTTADNGRVWYIYKTKTGEGRYGYLPPETVCKLLDNILRCEYDLFTFEELTKIKSYLDKINCLPSAPNHTTNSVSRINKVFYKNLSLKLTEGFTKEINEDLGKVIDKIKYFKFPEVIIKALEKIEKIYWDTSKDEFDYSMAIGELREYWSLLIKLIAENIKKIVKDSFPTTEKTEIANLRIYIKRNLQLDEENALINIFIEIVNNKGSHNLISPKEYFRLTKNINIEVTLLLLTKLENFQNTCK